MVDDESLSSVADLGVTDADLSDGDLKAVLTTTTTKKVTETRKTVQTPEPKISFDSEKWSQAQLELQKMIDDLRKERKEAEQKETDRVSNLAKDHEDRIRELKESYAKEIESLKKNLKDQSDVELQQKLYQQRVDLETKIADLQKKHLEEVTFTMEFEMPYVTQLLWMESLRKMSPIQRSSGSSRRWLTTSTQIPRMWMTCSPNF